MPAEKAARAAVKRRAYNRLTTGKAKSERKSAEVLIAQGKVQEAAQAIQHAYSALDKAARKKAIHPNAAARRKSRLMKKLTGYREPALASAKPRRRRKAAAGGSQESSPTPA